MVDDLTGQAPLLCRHARLDDVDALEELEFDCFDSDRFTRRRWRYMLTRAHALTLVLASDTPTPLQDDELHGYAMLLLRTNSDIGHVHSLCIHPDRQRQGEGARLLQALEAAAVNEKCARLRLHVHMDNEVAQRLYKRHGYRRYHWHDDFYEDGAAAWVLEKRLK